MKPNFVKHLFQITVFLSISIFIGCQKNSISIETPVVIENQVFDLPENSPAGTVIGPIKVTNTTATGLKYYLVSGDYSNAFRMETSTGMLILKDSSMINYEAIKQIELEVMVGYDDSSKGYGVFANILIQVEDKSETYTWISENAHGGNQDAVVNSLNPGSSLATNNYLFITTWTNNLEPFVIRSFLQFDLASIPTDAIISGATLSLYNPSDGIEEHKHFTYDGSNSFYIRRVTSSWEDQTITWNNQPDFSIEGQVGLPGNETDQQDYKKTDITEMIKYMLKYPAENHGFVIMFQDETYFHGTSFVYRRLCFASLEHPVESLRPKLEITYIK
jgi:hypothetical protein